MLIQTHPIQSIHTNAAVGLIMCHVQQLSDNQAVETRSSTAVPEDIIAKQCSADVVPTIICEAMARFQDQTLLLEDTIPLLA